MSGRTSSQLEELFQPSHETFGNEAGFVLHQGLDWSSLPATRARVFLTLADLLLNVHHALLPLQGNLLLTGDKDQLVMLLDQINSTFVRSNLSVLQGLLRIIPYLSFGEMEKMQILVDRFKPYCNFDKYVVIFQLEAREVSCTDKSIPFFSHCCLLQCNANLQGFLAHKLNFLFHC